MRALYGIFVSFLAATPAIAGGPSPDLAQALKLLCSAGFKDIKPEAVRRVWPVPMTPRREDGGSDCGGTLTLMEEHRDSSIPPTSGAVFKFSDRRDQDGACYLRLSGLSVIQWSERFLEAKQMAVHLVDALRPPSAPLKREEVVWVPDHDAGYTYRRSYVLQVRPTMVAATEAHLSRLKDGWQVFVTVDIHDDPAAPQ